MGSTSKRIGGILAVVVLTMAACSTTNNGGNTGLTGTVSGDGSSTVGPIMEALAEEFKQVEPGVNVNVGISGTGGGFEAFCKANGTDFSDASRPIKEDEEAPLCADAGVEFTELQIAIDGMVVAINPENTWAECLTPEQLAAIWSPDSKGKVNSWKDVDPSFPDVKLELWGPGSDSGTFDYFNEVIIEEYVGDDLTQRTDYGNIGEEDDQAVANVADSRGGMAYFGYSYLANAGGIVKPVSIDAGAGCVEPNDTTVRDGTYTPLARPLFVYVNHAALDRPEVVAFFDFLFDTVNSILGDVGYFPMDDEDFQVSVDTWNGLKA
ncbi:MAG TPA: PstS family phosphate ABC transporter substrate-binding protein [Actinomycetota bacterium]